MTIAIRPLRSADAVWLAALLSDNRAFLAPYEPDRPDAFFTETTQRERINAAGSHQYAILVSGEPVGAITLFNIFRGPLQSCALGYWVAESFNGRGVAATAVARIVVVAFEDLGLHRIEAATLTDNVASQRVLEKNGFIRIGVSPFHLQIAGVWRDHVLFARTAETYTPDVIQASAVLAASVVDVCSARAEA